MVLKQKAQELSAQYPALTYAEIGRRLGISRQRVHQLITGYKSPSAKESRKLWDARYRKTEKGRKVARKSYLKWALRIRCITLMHYGNGKLACVQCGFSDIRALSIDHKAGNGAAHRRSIGNKTGINFYKWLIDNNFPDGYQTLCMNCQRIKFVENEEWAKNSKLP